MGRRRSRLVLALVAACALLAACGGSPSSPSSADDAGTAADSEVGKQAQQVYDRFNQMQGEERRRALVEAANKEGALSIYTSNTDIDDVVEGFEDKYPDIDVSVYRANSETALQRLLQEQRAGFYGVDVFETNAGELGIAHQNGLLADYRSELRDKVREEGQRDGWTASRFNVFVVGWNTKLVKPGQEPKSLEELADPKWKGKISMEVGDIDWFAAMYGHYQQQGKSDAEIRDLFSRLAANAKVVRGHTVQGELLSAGQFAVAVSNYTYLTQRLADDGAPVAYKPLVEPVIARPNGVGLMNTAKHPAAALLFTTWILTKGQDVLIEEGLTPSVKGKETTLEGVEVIPVDVKELAEQNKKWSDLYQQVVSEGEQVAESGG
jgi:iron(III) transport system substrate-binding protein